MTPELYQVRKQEIKAAHLALVEKYTEKICASKKLAKERIATLFALLPPPIPKSIEKRRKEESYDIQRALHSRITKLDKIRGWDVEKAEVKFNNADDLLIFEVAIQKSQE